ncbi:MAG TPA: HPr-rel-A system PqqD family peptide chaperone [Stellaceae bacterium]|nr:HPr-rel-A system PqqD family peptide chaperone [Stellaceae bacterium]
MGPICKLNRLSSLSWRQFGAEWAFFDEGSGDTHVVDAVAAATLMCIEAGTFDASALAEQVAVELDLEPSEALSQGVAASVERFTILGLIEPAAS